MNIIRVISKKIPKTNTGSLKCVVEYQNTLSSEVVQFPGFINSNSYWVVMDDNYVDRPIYNISSWKSEDDWKNWYNSEIRKNINSEYSSIVKKESHEILINRIDYNQIPLL